MPDYHAEFKALIAQFEGYDLLKFLLYDVVEPILSRNPHYHRCNKPNSAGLCVVLQEFRDYASKGQRPPDKRLRFFGVTTYPLWLLGDKLRQAYEDNLQRRVSECFKGDVYYDAGIPGFRQFEYELQTLCRLIEEGIPFADDPGKGDPDLIVEPGGLEFPLEIKMPVSNPEGALRDAFKKIGSMNGIVLISLDMLVNNVDPADLETTVRDVAVKLKEQLQTSKNVGVILEAYSSDGSESLVGWLGGGPIDAVMTIMKAQTGHPYTRDNLPPPLA